MKMVLALNVLNDLTNCFTKCSTKLNPFVKIGENCFQRRRNHFQNVVALDSYEDKCLNSNTSSGVKSLVILPK